MENYEYIKNDITVQIQIGESDHNFSHVKNGVTYEYSIKGFRTDYKDKSVSVDYCLTVKDSQGSILSAQVMEYTEANILRYSALYQLNSFYEFAGDFYGKQCVNGVMERNIGFKCFNTNGDLLTE